MGYSQGGRERRTFVEAYALGDTWLGVERECVYVRPQGIL